MTVWEFTKRVGIVTVAAVGIVTLSGLIHKWANAEAMAAIATEKEERIAADNSLINFTTRLAKIVELQAVLNVEPDGSAERKAALRELRGMRRLGLSDQRP